MLLSVIIVNYNVKYYLEQCLHSLQRAGIGMAMEVIVVDNNSSDGSRPYLMSRFPDSGVRFIWDTTNQGFAGACNKGLHLAKGRFILFLNPDTLVPEDSFQLLLAFFQQYPDAGAVGVRMLDGSGKFLRESKRGYPSLSATFFKFSGLTHLWPASPVFSRYYLGHLNEQETNEVEVLSGAFMAMPRDKALMLGGFDETFFMYGEDIDLSVRVKQSGLNVFYFPAITILHFKGESTQKSSRQYLRNFYGAMEIFVRKHQPAFQAMLYRLVIKTIVYLKVLSLASGTGFHGRRQNVTSSIKGLMVVHGENNAPAIIDVLVQKKMLPDVKIRYCALHENVETALLNHTAHHALLFFIGNLTVKKALTLLAQFGRTNRVLFHYVGSDSVIG